MRNASQLIFRFISQLILLLAGLVLVSSFLTGCGLLPSYTVRIENESSKTVLARIERRPSMNNMIVLDSGRVKSGGSRVLGPVEAPPLERVYIVIQSPENLHALPDSHKISRGSWVVTISKGSINSWGAYDISVSKE